MTDDYQPPELRILHWNIHSWRDDKGAPNLERVAELVSEIKPDAVSLVEVDEGWDKPNLLDQLAAQCGYASVFNPSLEFGQGEPAGGFGNAILTPLPILAVRQRQLVWPIPSYDGSEPSEPRSVLFVKVETSTGPIWVGSTHLPRSDENTRMSALRRLIGISEQLDGPWLVVGDFNLPAAAWLGEYATLRAHPEPAVATYPARESVEAIDYCVVPTELRVETEVLEVMGSDHLAVLVRIER